MSDTPAPSIAASPPLPTTWFGWMERLFRIGWRPAGMWVSVAVLFVNGAAIPAARVLLHLPLEPLPWRDVTIFAGMFTVTATVRGLEKVLGASA